MRTQSPVAAMALAAAAEELHVPIDCIVGTCMGVLIDGTIAAVHAAG